MLQLVRKRLGKMRAGLAPQSDVGKVLKQGARALLIIGSIKPNRSLHPTSEVRATSKRPPAAEIFAMKIISQNIKKATFRWLFLTSTQQALALTPYPWISAIPTSCYPIQRGCGCRRCRLFRRRRTSLRLYLYHRR